MWSAETETMRQRSGSSPGACRARYESCLPGGQRNPQRHVGRTETAERTRSRTTNVGLPTAYKAKFT